MRQARLFRFGAWLIPASVTIVLTLLTLASSATASAGTRCGYDISKYNYDANADLARGNFTPPAVAVVASGSPGGVVGVSNEVARYVYDPARSLVAPGSLADDAARLGDDAVGAVSPTLEVGGTRYIYGDRVLNRAVAEPGPYHNFPSSFDADVLTTGTRGGCE